MVARDRPRHGACDLHVPQSRGCRLDALGRCWGQGGEQTPPDGRLGGGALRGRRLAVRWGLGLRGRGRSLLVFTGLSSSEVFGVPNAFTRDGGRPWTSAPRRLVVYTHTKILPAGAVVNRIDSFGSRGVAFGAAGSDLHRTGPTVSFVPVYWVLRWPRGSQQHNKRGQEGVAGGWRSVGQRATVATGAGGAEQRRRSRMYSEDSVPCGATS